ncbi:MAG: NAD(P)-dependent oxidoreductase [Pirellulales bacterium]
MKRVLVTGARGFIGRHCLLHLLELGYEVVAVSTMPTPLQSLAATHCADGSVTNAGSKIEWRTADLLDPQQTQRLLDETRPTHLLHLAWYAKPGAYWNSPENLRWLEASQDLLRRFQARGGERVVVAGTCAEYVETTGIHHEIETPVRPKTLYGKCKHALHQYLDCLSEVTGLHSAWARIFLLYGADGPPEKFPQTVVASVVRGQPALCSHGRQVKDFLHVSDTADALVALLESPVQGVVNIGSGQGQQLAEMAERLAARCGRLDLLKLGALPARPNEPAALIADISRLRDEVGWSPRIDCHAGLDQLADAWLRSMAHEEAA